MILSRDAIQKEIADGNIKLNPSVSDDDYSPSSVDIHLGNEITVFKLPSPALITCVDLSHPDLHKVFSEITNTVIIDTHGFKLNPGEFILAWTKENITLPSHIGARLEGRSTIARFGICIHSTAPTVHPTFSGNLRLEISNQGKLPCMLYSGLKIGQLIFEMVSIPSDKVLDSVWMKQGPIGKS